VTEADARYSVYVIGLDIYVFDSFVVITIRSFHES